jgi:hypothetical protein
MDFAASAYPSSGSDHNASLFAGSVAGFEKDQIPWREAA